MQRLFVYGSLAPGRPNHHLLAAIPGTWEAGTLRGLLLDEGWGSDMGFPGLIPSELGEDVTGHVLSSEHLSRHWSMLDDFEGAGYRRVIAEVRLASGDRHEAFVYALTVTGETPGNSL